MSNERAHPYLWGPTQVISKDHFNRQLRTYPPCLLLLPTVPMLSLIAMASLKKGFAEILTPLALLTPLKIRS